MAALAAPAGVRADPAPTVERGPDDKPAAGPVDPHAVAVREVPSELVANIRDHLKPPALLRESPAKYPDALLENPVSGAVKLQLVVDVDGAVDSASVLQHVHPLLDDSALDAAMRLRFSPAEIDGKPVAVKIEFTYNFAAVARPKPPAPIPTGVVSGVIRSRGNRKPVTNAVLAWGETHSITTDERGRFRVELPAGEQKLLVRAPGFAPVSFDENVEVGKVTEVVYAVTPQQVNAYETVVRAARERTEVSRVSLYQQEIREVPGTMGDPFRVVMLMPGVGSVVSGLGYPVVRGASPASTGYYLDGIRIPILYHLFLGPAVVHPDFIDGIDFYPGAPPTRFGRLLGGVIDGRVRGPREDRLHASVYLDVLNAGAFLETPIDSSGTDISLSGRYSYTPWLLALAANSMGSSDPQVPSAKWVLNFWDYQGRIEQSVGSGKLRLMAFGSSDTFGTVPDGKPVFASAQDILFHRVDLRYRQPVGDDEAEVGVTWGLDKLGFDANDPSRGGTSFNIAEDSYAARAGYSLKLDGRSRLNFGADLENRRARVDLQGSTSVFPTPPVDIHKPVAIGTLAGAYGELQWKSADARWSLVPGLRLDSFHLVPGHEYLALEPRLTVRHTLSDGLTLKGGAGLYHQAPTTLIQLPVVDVAGLTYGLQRALQLDTGAEVSLGGGFELNGDVYFNPLLRTVEINPFDANQINPGAAPQVSYTNGQLPGLDQVLGANNNYRSRGWAYGLELMLRHQLGKNWFGWVSYTLQRSTRLEGYALFDRNGNVVGRGAGYLPYAFDQTHILNAVLSVRLGNWTLGAAAHFNTGRPETGVMTSATMRQATDSTGQPMWVRVDAPASGRLPAFLRLDLRVSRTWVFDDFLLDTYLDVLNATLATETLGYTYTGGVFGGGGALQRLPQGLPIVLPVLGIKATY